MRDPRSLAGSLTTREGEFGLYDCFTALADKRVCSAPGRNRPVGVIYSSGNGDSPTAEVVRELLADVAEGRAETFPAVGLGEDVRIRGSRTTGAALVVEGRVVHLCAFRNDDEQDNDSGLGGFGRILRASRRRSG